MQENPEVVVQEILPEALEQILSGHPPIAINLGGGQSLDAALLEGRTEQLRKAIRERAQRVFLLSWMGNKIPCGAVVEGYTIGWTQNGMVTSQAGQHIGAYDRLMEFAGKSRQVQQMLVYLTASPRVRPPLS